MRGAMTAEDVAAWFRGKRVFVTGGTGFFGKSLLDLVRRRGWTETEFVLLSRAPERFGASVPELSALPCVRFVPGDVRSFAFPSGRFDLVIHGAAPALTTLAPGEQRSIIVEGSRRVLEFVRVCGAEKVLMISSGAVYGPQGEVEKAAEDLPCRPVTEYGIAKLEAERMFLDSGIPTAVARGFAFVGRFLNRDIHFAIGNFIRDVLAGREVVVKGDGTALRSYLYADDLAEWLLALAARPEEQLVCNVGSDRAVSIRELAHTVCRALGRELTVRVLTPADPGRPVERYVPDVSRAGALGLRVKVGLEEAIRRSAGADAPPTQDRQH